MKKLFYLLVLSTLLGISCQKEVIYPSDELSAKTKLKNDKNKPKISTWGKFLIIDAVMYVDDKQTGERFVYNHFGFGKDTSSLRWGGSIFDIEQIVKNKTTYSFWEPNNAGLGKFMLNDDTTKYYCVQYNGQNKTIIEDPNRNQQNMGGSARPFSGQTVDYYKKIVQIQIQEAEGVDDKGHAIHYWNQLTLIKIEEW